MSIDKNKQEDIYKKNAKTGGITEKNAGEQSIRTEKTKILKDSNKEVLIGKDIDKIDKIKENHESLQRKILNKLMK